MVTAQYLLEGMVYSLEQCGKLLHDANTLYKDRSYANAIVLAAFAREELGRAQILEEIRAEVVDGKCVTLEEITDQCGDHVSKQERGQLSVVQRATGDQGLAKLHRTMFQSHPHSTEYKEAREQLDRAANAQRKRIPQDRHELRMKSLYVEPTENGLSWNRPSEAIQAEAFNFLCDAVNDYAVQLDRFQSGILEQIDPELWQALRQWPGRPELPQPQWPSYGVSAVEGGR